MEIINDDNFNVLVTHWVNSCLLYLRKKKNKRWQNRRWLVRPINTKRNENGDFNNLFNDIKGDQEHFYRYTRMTYGYFQLLLKLIEPHVQKKSWRALVPELRLLICLRYLATGDSPYSIALAFRAGESTVSEIVKEVCRVLIKVLQLIYLSPPTKEDWKNCAEGFWKAWNIPNCVGSVDGKHIRLKCPPNSGSLYFNYKKYFSIVLMAVADHLYRFTLVDIGAYGGNSDGGIFNDSEIGERLRNGNLNLENKEIPFPGSNLKSYTYFVADDAFKLSNRIMKPYSRRNLNYKEKIFNYRLSRARRTVESTFGIFSGKWRIFQSAITMLPATADLIISASTCLHNFVPKEEQKSGFKRYSQELTFDNTTDQELPWMDVSNITEQLESSVAIGEKQRDKLSDYFVSEQGSVNWQHENVHRGVYADE
ncbi:uncharacterized protein [Prorops nasuta]|uniref:uncharacterized protein n=1 Tax=Prorops nasuta TaxID=863751 RepID=UPI0034CF5DB9